LDSGAHAESPIDGTEEIAQKIDTDGGAINRAVTLTFFLDLVSGSRYHLLANNANTIEHEIQIFT
jgi:hypothetical protein